MNIGFKELLKYCKENSIWLVEWTYDEYSTIDENPLICYDRFGISVSINDHSFLKDVCRMLMQKNCPSFIVTVR